MIRSLRFITAAAMLLVTTLVFTSCEGTLDDIFGEWSRPIAVTNITLSETSLTKFVGDDAFTLTAAVDPNKATDKAVTWTSSDENVLTVSDGVVTIVGKGTAIITAKAGDKTAKCTVKVFDLVNLSTLTDHYDAQSYDILTGTLEGSTQPYKISIAAGATVTLKDATINGVNNGSCKWAGITCLGDATIILEGENTVKAFSINYPGIQPAHNTSGDEFTLTIKGDGKLDAICRHVESYGINNIGYGAGIGAGFDESKSCGNIVIEGGTITAAGTSSAAGIGAAYKGTCGTITIRGGKVTALGGTFAAGIGSGNGNSSNVNWGKCGNITISGGTVEATGNNGGAGIGGGTNGKCGTITISGGTIEATGNNGGAGIGGGINGKCGTITISDGNVTASGGSFAAGIGGGIGKNTDADLGSCGDIIISGGSGSATKGISATYSIGKGQHSACGTITINGVVVGDINTDPYTW